jgi:hypothetical protein
LNVHNLHVPEFHLVVNFPEHLARGRKDNNTATNKGDVELTKCCVMCGKERALSSGATHVRYGKKDTDDDDDNNDATNNTTTTVHIIPRQNKGVCTACDTAVWVLTKRADETKASSTGTTTNTNNKLEIKWCKGCKNFRPWPCFGEKVLATKCVRCRDRQKEKYAASKNNNTSKYIASNTDARTATEQAEVLAADGLRNLRKS